MADPSEKITVDDCRVGAWVEVSNGGKEPWRGMIAKVDPTSSQPIAVKWVGNATPGLAVKPGVKWPTNTPDGLYTWRGGIHFVELETLLEVNDDLFHVANRKGLQHAELPCKPANVFCYERTCRGRCTGVPSAWHPPPPAKQKHAAGAKGKVKPAAQPTAKAKLKPPPPPKTKPKPPPPPKTHNKPGPKPHSSAAKKEEAQKATAAAKKGSNEKVKPAEEKKRKYDDAGLGKYFEWEHNITGDCKPSDVLVPFTYHTSRIFNLEPGGVNYLVEKRADPNNVRCSCSTSLLPALTDLLGNIEDLHKISKGQCPYRALQCGGILYHMHVYQDPVGKGYGVRTMEPIKKGALICEYSGEVITTEEATLREQSYVQLGLFYLHDVHGKYSKDKYTIDPTMYGNVARMLNHSCDPNVSTLHIIPVNIMGDKIPKVPRLVLFAKRDIDAEEELCIDYSPGRDREDQLQKVMRCFCKTSKCKGWLF